jgi:hypothetical protein
VVTSLVALVPLRLGFPRFRYFVAVAAAPRARRSGIRPPPAVRVHEYGAVQSPRTRRQALGATSSPGRPVACPTCDTRVARRGRAPIEGNVALVADLIAICQDCSTAFAASNVIGGSGGTIVFKDSVIVGCPSCGGVGRIPDGQYRLLDDVITIVQGTSRNELAALYKILRDSTGPEEVVERIGRDAPSFAEMARQKSKSPADWKFWVSLIVGVLGVLLSPYYTQMVQGEPPSREDIQRIIHEQLPRQQGAPSEPQLPPQGIPPGAGAEPKIRRNDPCPCGSGMKYKRCHGAPPSSRLSPEH